jgi:hypothetical protein
MPIPVELKAKRIVTLVRENKLVDIVCFEYEHDQLEKYEHLVGAKVNVTLIDTNGEFSTPRDTFLQSIRAPNRGNWGAPDDVMIVTIYQP